MNVKNETVKEYRKRYYLTHKKKISKQNKIWREKNIEKVRARLRVWARDYRKKCFAKLSPEQLKEWRIKNNTRNKKYRENNLEKLRQYHRRRHLYKTYKITEEFYLELIEKQKHRCSICKELTEKQKFHIDHNHETGKVRGLLCGKCNRGIGMLREDLQILKNAIKYLKNYY